VAGVAVAIAVALLGRDRVWQAQAPPAGPTLEPGASAPLPVPRNPLPPAGPRAPATEAELMDRLRADVDDDPAAAVALANELEREHPDGRWAEERSYAKMRALVHLGDIAAARDEAEAFFARHPRSALGPDVHHLTGVRPRPIPNAPAR
jgi:hypothetical protein